MTISKIALRGVSLLALATPLSAMAQTTSGGAPQAEAVTQEAAGTATESETTAKTTAADNDIVVTARRREESIQDVPAVINAVTGAEFEQLNFQEFSEIQQVVPGLLLQSNSNAFGANAQLRGVSFDVNLSGFNNTVEFYQNDAPVLPQLVLQQTYDIQQVEVLRGPQGTLRGRAAPSGSLTVTTRKPDLRDINGYADLSASSIGNINFNGGINVPVIQDKAAIRVAGLVNEDELNRVRTVNGAEDRRDPRSRTLSGRISGLVEPTDWLRLEGVYQRTDRRSRLYDQVESFDAVSGTLGPSPDPIAANDRQAISDRPRINREKYDLYTWQAAVKYGGQNLVYVGSHFKQVVSSFEPQDFGNFFTARDFGQDTNGTTTGNSHEVRLQNEERLFGAFDYVVGVFFRDTNSVNMVRRESEAPVPPAGLAFAQAVQFVTSVSTSNERSFFGSLTYHIDDSTAITGGLRHIKYKSFNDLDLDAFTVGGAPLPVAPANLSTSQQRATALVYQASIQHFFTPDVMVYASTASSFRPPAFAVGDFGRARTPRENSFLQVPKETSKSYEIGLKSTLMDRKLRFNVTGFYQKFKNFPYRAPGQGVYYNDTSNGSKVNTFNFVSAVPVEVYGIEGDVGFQITPNWDIGGVFSYAKSEIKNGTIPCNDFGDEVGGTAGDGQPDSPANAPPTPATIAVGDNIAACQVTQSATTQPKFSASLQTEYRFDVSDRLQAFTRGLYSFFGKTGSDPTNKFDSVKAFGVLNLFAGVRDPDGKWEVSAFGKNVFDQDRVIERTLPLQTTFVQGPAVTSTYTRIRISQPREFGLNVRYNF